MTESKELALPVEDVRLPGLPERFQPRNLTELMSWSKLVTSSGLAPKGMNEAGVVLCVQHGAEIGITPTQSLQNIAVINGRPSIFGDLGLALFKRDAKGYALEERAPDQALKAQAGWCKITAPDGKVTERTFSVDEAKAARLWAKDGPWSTYPGRMLMFRARWWAMRDTVPHIFKGLSAAEELQDVHEADFRVTGSAPLTEPRRRSEGVTPGEVDNFLKGVKGAPASSAPNGGGGPAPAAVDRATLKKVMVISAAEKTGGGKTFYAIVVETSTGGKVEATTFSKTDYETATGLKGKFALVATKSVTKGEKTYTNLTHIEAAPEEGEAPPQEEPGANG